MRKGHKAWSRTLCFFISAAMAFTPSLTAAAAHTAGDEDTKNVKYYYEKDEDTGDYFRSDIKSIYIAPNSYYDTMIEKDPNFKTAWNNPAGKSSEDQTKANEVIVLIDALPSVRSIALSDKVQIDQAMKAYTALTDTQKNLVTNAGDLTAAERKWNSIKAELDVSSETDPAYTKAYAESVVEKAKSIAAIDSNSGNDDIRKAATTAKWARLAYELVTDDEKTNLAADTDPDVIAALEKINVKSNSSTAVCTEVAAINLLAAQLPAWFPLDTDQAASTEEVDAANTVCTIIMEIYETLDAAQKSQLKIDWLSEFDTDNSYEEPTDTGNVIDHSPGEIHKEVNISFLDYMIKTYLLEDWAHLADAIFASQGEVANYVSNSDYKKYYQGNASRGLNVLSALSSPDGNKSGGWGKSNAWRYTGLKSATSLSQVRNAMADEVRSGANRKAVDRGEILDKGELTIGKDRLENLKSTDKTKAFYSIATYVDRSKWDTAITYQSYGMCFYDFDLAVISDDDLEYVNAAEKYKDEEHPMQAAVADSAPGVSFKSNAGSSGARVSSYTENNSKEDTDVAMEYVNSDSTSVSTTFETSETFSYSEMIGSETKIGNDDTFVAETIKLEFTAEQAFTKARGKGEAQEQKVEHAISTSVSIPAQTAIQIIQNKEQTDASLKFDTPVAITFKVAIFSIGGHGTATGVCTNFVQDVAGYKTSDYCTIFGGKTADEGFSANENLHRRAVANVNIGGYDQAYGNTSGVFKNVGGRRPTLESIDWKGSFTDDQLLAIKYMTERRPMAPSGSTMTVTMKHFSTEIGEVFPLYLLKNIALKENISDEYEMSVGDTFSIKQLTVDGLNKNNVPYYGFDPDDGHWVFCDKSGNVEDHSDYVRYKDTSTDSGRSKLVATQKGVQYLKWILNNDVVNDKKYTALNEPGYTDNDSLNSVMVKLTIKEEPFAGKVMLDGTYTGYVDEAPVLLPDNGLEVTLEDTTGKEVSRQVTWMAKERKGIKVTEDGEVSFTEPGTYNVRVYVGEDPQDLEKGSEWVEIKALDKKQAASLEISDDNDPKLLEEHVYSGTTESLDLSKLTVKGQDQYGNPWSYKPEDITWNVNGSDLQGTDFDVNGAGTYTICAKAGELTSNKLTLAVHELKKVEKKDATCTADGNKEYYECIDCHKLYSDDKAAKEMSKADVKVKALGHAWDKGTVKEAKASGTGTFTLTCTRDSKHKQVKKINNLLLSAKSSGNRITFKWTKEKLADGYEVYFAKCGGKDQLSSCKLVKTIKNNGTLTYKSGKVVNGKFYKGYVKAFKKISGKKVYLSTSHGVHLIAGNYTKKATNPKAVTVKTKTLSVNVGKTKKITGAKVTKMKGGRKLLTHDKKLRYGSSDSRIATVAASGKITGVAKGNCTVYVIGINGVRAAVKVSVK